MESLEELAHRVGNDPKLLKKRLLESVAVLTSRYREFFKRGTLFDFENKRLYSSDHSLYLQWSIREYPDHPPSYNNQQTSGGCVQLLRKVYFKEQAHAT